MSTVRRHRMGALQPPGTQREKQLEQIMRDAAVLEQRLAKEASRHSGLLTDNAVERERRSLLEAELSQQASSSAAARRLADTLRSKLPELRSLMAQMYDEESGMQGTLHQRHASISGAAAAAAAQHKEAEQAALIAQIRLDRQERELLESLLRIQTAHDDAKSQVAHLTADLDRHAKSRPALEAERAEVAGLLSLSDDPDAFQTRVRKAEDTLSAVRRRGGARVASVQETILALQSSLLAVSTQRQDLLRASALLQAVSPDTLRRVISPPGDGGGSPPGRGGSAEEVTGSLAAALEAVGLIPKRQQLRLQHASPRREGASSSPQAPGQQRPRRDNGGSSSSGGLGSPGAPVPLRSSAPLHAGPSGRPSRDAPGGALASLAVPQDLLAALKRGREQAAARDAMVSEGVREEAAEPPAGGLRTAAPLAHVTSRRRQPIEPRSGRDRGVGGGGAAAKPPSSSGSSNISSSSGGGGRLNGSSVPRGRDATPESSAIAALSSPSSPLSSSWRQEVWRDALAPGGSSSSGRGDAPRGGGTRAAPRDMPQPAGDAGAGGSPRGGELDPAPSRAKRYMALRSVDVRRSSSVPRGAVTRELGAVTSSAAPQPLGSRGLGQGAKGQGAPGSRAAPADAPRNRSSSVPRGAFAPSSSSSSSAPGARPLSSSSQRAPPLGHRPSSTVTAAAAAEWERERGGGRTTSASRPLRAQPTVPEGDSPWSRHDPNGPPAALAAVGAAPASSLRQRRQGAPPAVVVVHSSARARDRSSRREQQQQQGVDARGRPPATATALLSMATTTASSSSFASGGGAASSSLLRDRRVTWGEVLQRASSPPQAPPPRAGLSIGSNGPSSPGQSGSPTSPGHRYRGSPKGRSPQRHFTAESSPGERQGQEDEEGIRQQVARMRSSLEATAEDARAARDPTRAVDAETSQLLALYSALAVPHKSRETTPATAAAAAAAARSRVTASQPPRHTAAAGASAPASQRSSGREGSLPPPSSSQQRPGKWSASSVTAAAPAHSAFPARPSLSHTQQQSDSSGRGADSPSGSSISPTLHDLAAAPMYDPPQDGADGGVGAELVSANGFQDSRGRRPQGRPPPPPTSNPPLGRQLRRGDSLSRLTADSYSSAGGQRPLEMEDGEEGDATPQGHAQFPDEESAASAAAAAAVARVAAPSSLQDPEEEEEEGGSDAAIARGLSGRAAAALQRQAERRAAAASAEAAGASPPPVAAAPFAPSSPRQPARSSSESGGGGGTRASQQLSPPQQAPPWQRPRRLRVSSNGYADPLFIPKDIYKWLPAASQQLQ